MMPKTRRRRPMSVLETSLIGVIAIGLLHGLEPCHGWPIALLYSVRTRRPTFYAFVSSGIISFFHFSFNRRCAPIFFAYPTTSKRSFLSKASPPVILKKLAPNSYALSTILFASSVLTSSEAAGFPADVQCTQL